MLSSNLLLKTTGLATTPYPYSLEPSKLGNTYELLVSKEVFNFSYLFLTQRLIFAVACAPFPTGYTVTITFPLV